MKKAQPRKKRETSAKAARTTKSKSSPKSVDEYIAHLPEPSQTKLKQVRAAIRSVVPAETTEVISYGIPAFKQKRVLVWYAAFADHWSLFPTAAVIERFKDELKGYTTSKGTIQFLLDKPIPTALIRKLVKSRVAGV
jgi:uncharacterized protein YdhG (YjbR/CyaY superfamily)